MNTAQEIRLDMKYTLFLTLCFCFSSSLILLCIGKRLNSWCKSREGSIVPFRGIIYIGRLSERGAVKEHADCALGEQIIIPPATNILFSKFFVLLFQYIKRHGIVVDQSMGCLNSSRVFHQSLYAGFIQNTTRDIHVSIPNTVAHLCQAWLYECTVRTVRERNLN